jgi:outer membrane protein TolC
LRQEAEYLPILEEILKLKWEEAPHQAQSDDTKRIGLEKILHETLQHSIMVKQAEVQIKDAEAQAKEIRDPGLFNLLNPVDTPSLKKAAEYNIQAAKAHLRAARQKALLESARMYGDLTQAFLGKYLAYQAIEQGRSQLREEQERFIAGETNHFDVTQTQMALVDRYGKYLNADNLYHTASIALASQISASKETALLPEVGDLQDQNAMVPLFKLLPEDLTLEKVLKAARIRPDGQEINYRRQSLQGLVKAASGLDKQKKQAELHQLELEIEKASDAVLVLAEKAFADYQLSQKNLILAQQRYALAYRFAYQMHVSHNAGFSSAKDVLESQIELARVKTGLIGAQVAYNLSQIQLLYEMGMLDEDILSHPPSWPPNAL